MTEVQTFREPNFPVPAVPHISWGQKCRMELINRCIENASAKYGVDKNLIRAIIKQESNFDPYALSHSVPRFNAADAWNGRCLKCQWPLDIAQNIDGGTRYIRISSQDLTAMLFLPLQHTMPARTMLSSMVVFLLLPKPKLR